MKFRRSLLLSVTALAAAIGCDKPAAESRETQSAPPVDPVHGHLLQAQPKLPVVTVLVGTNVLTAELARRPVEIATGMMFRTNLLENEAMLFVFSCADRRSFYMRNCVVPLSAAYISPTGEILQVARLDPGDERGVLSYSDNIQFVLEVRQGFLANEISGCGQIRHMQCDHIGLAG